MTDRWQERRRGGARGPIAAGLVHALCLALLVAAPPDARAEETDVVFRTREGLTLAELRELEQRLGPARVDELAVPRAKRWRIDRQKLQLLESDPRVQYVEAVRGDLGRLFAGERDAPSLTPEIERRRLQIRSRPTTERLRIDDLGPARFKLDALRQGSLKLNLFDTAVLDVKRERIEKRGQRDFVWYGKLAEPGSSAILVVKGRRITGTVRKGRDVYQILPLDDRNHAIIKLDLRRMPPDHAADDDFEEADSDGPLPTLDFSEATLDDEGRVQIDALIIYTPDAARSIPDMESYVELAVAETNGSYLNSGVKIRLVPVFISEVDYDEAGSMSMDKTRLSASGDGHLEEVPALRDEHQADIAVLVVDNSSECGKAAIGATAEKAFAIVHYTCLVGKYSLAHEIGHLMGALHDDSPANLPFPYGHGFVYGSLWRTIMAKASGCDQCTRLQYWSSPHVMYEGVGMGTLERADNARVLNERAAVVASFR